MKLQFLSCLYLISPARRRSEPPSAGRTAPASILEECQLGDPQEKASCGGTFAEPGKGRGAEQLGRPLRSESVWIAFRVFFTVATVIREGSRLEIDIVPDNARTP